jgi:RNA polymerase sigma factor (sigma-70 family)
MAIAPTEVAGIEESTAIRLVTAHRCGDRDAFAEIVGAHYPALLATARHRLGNPEDAKDAVQETLLRALLALDRFGDTGDWRLGAWLNTILIHVCADMPARRGPTMPLDDWVIETVPDNVAAATSDPVALAAVKRAIDDLPDRQRRAFQLRLVDDLPYEQVARTLGITEVNARARVKRARVALQRSLSSSDAVKGAWAAFPLLLTSPVRSVLRRVFSGAGDSARAAGSQTLATGAVSGSPAASAIAGTPVATGLQLITQVSTTPLGQAVVASATSAPGRGSVVLGIVASLATAGGLSAPAVISGSTPPVRPASVRAAATTTGPATSPATTSSPAAPTSNGSATATGSNTATGASSAATSPIHHLSAPTWMTLALAGGAYRLLASNTSPATTTAPSTSTGTTSTGTTSTGTTSTGTTSTGTTSTGTTSTGTTSTGTSGSSSSTGSASSSSTGSGTAGSGATSTTGSGTSAGSTAAQHGTIALPIGTCAGVTGFPGVTAPTSIPAPSSSVLDAVLSTGTLGLAKVGGSPSFAGTALVKATTGSTSPVHVKVGTCLADGGSILAVDLTGSTGDEVQLVGALVAQPFATSTGADAYLFRGNVTQLAGTEGPGGALPWSLPKSFVAEVQVQSKANTGSLTVVFLQSPSGTPTATVPAVPPPSPGTATATSASTPTSGGSATTGSTNGEKTPPAVISGGTATSI